MNKRICLKFQNKKMVHKEYLFEFIKENNFDVSVLAVQDWKLLEF